MNIDQLKKQIKGLRAILCLHQQLDEYRLEWNSYEFNKRMLISHNEIVAWMPEGVEHEIKTTIHDISVRIESWAKKQLKETNRHGC